MIFHFADKFVLQALLSLPLFTILSFIVKQNGIGNRKCEFKAKQSSFAVNGVYEIRSQ